MSTAVEVLRVRPDGKGHYLKVVKFVSVVGVATYTDYALQRTYIRGDGLESVLSSFPLSEEEAAFLNLEKG